MAVLAGTMLWAIAAEVSSVNWVEHTNRVIRHVKDAQLDLRDMAVATRSYWLSPDSKYLAEFEKADRRLTGNLSAISALVSDNPVQSQHVIDVTDLKGAWIGAVQTLEIRPGNGASAL